MEEVEEYNFREVVLPSLIPKVPEPELERETEREEEEETYS